MWRARVHFVDMARLTIVYLFTAAERVKCVAAEEAPSLSPITPTATAPMAPTLTSDAQVASRLLFLLMAAIKITVAVEGRTLRRQTATHLDMLQEIFVLTSKTHPRASKLNNFCNSNNINSTRSKPRN